MEKLTMDINDFKDAFTYASDDEPDIAWLQNQFNVKITKNDSVAIIEGEEDDIITIYHQHHLEDYVSVRLTEKVEGSFGRYFFDKRDFGKQELLNDCDDLGLDCMEHYDSYEVTGSRVKIAKLLSLYNMQSAWKDIETLHKVEESTEQLNESETEDDDLQESIEKHNKLNPDLFENNELKEDVKESVKNIVNTFEEIIKKDGVKFKVKDIVLVGSNVSYNYTDDSDLDIHIIADSSVVKDNSEQSKKYLGILYNLYKSMFNSDYDITIHGVPAEVYVELDDIGAAKSNGIYSLNSGWIKEPVQEDIPDIDMEAFRKEFEEWERKYKELIKDLPQVDLEESTDPLQESSITRIGRQLEFENVAIISAYRYDNSTKENEQRQDELKNIIRNKLHLGYKEFRAKYVGNVEGTGEVITSYEYSLFVPNMTRKQAIKLGNQFDQQAIVVKDEDGIQEIATTDFIDDKGKQFKIGDVIRRFNSTGNFLNLKTAIDIFADRVSGAASKPLNVKHPFALKTVEDKKLESIFEVLDPKPSTFQTSKRYIVVYTKE